MINSLIGVRLSTGLGTITLAHIAFNISFVAIVVRARLAQFDSASRRPPPISTPTRWQAFRRVTLPLIAPGVAGGALLALTLSLDDVVVTSSCRARGRPPCRCTCSGWCGGE
jgi:spermidine/putrescine transport system permease protein